MKTNTLFAKRLISTAATLCGLIICQANATPLVISDPALNTGTNAVNKSSRTLVEAAGSTSEATLEALTGFAGIPSFAFAGNQAVSNEYIFAFTAEGSPDVRLRYMGAASSVANSSVSVATASFSTSISDSMRLGIGGTNRVFTLRIDAGTYAADVFTADQGLSALGFTLSSSQTPTAVPITINYYDSATNVLSVQTVYTPTSETGYRYTGYQSTGAPIAYVEIVYTSIGYATPTLTLDDLSFTVVSEPVTTLLVISDPELNAGTSAINKSGRPLVEAEGSTSQAALEALTGFAGIGSFAFPGNISVTNEYVFDFTPAETPDLRLRYLGASSQFAGTSVHVGTSTYSTSTPDSMRLGVGGIDRLFTMRIDAGTYAPEAFTADKGLSALGFTLSMGTNSVVPVEIKYYDSADNLLSAQTVSNLTSGTSYRYTGYQSAGEPIAYAEIVYSTTGIASAPTVTLDDLSFTVLSEPVTTLLVISDPVLNTGTNAINNFNRSLVEAEGSTSETALEALAGFAGIGSFAFPGNLSVTNEYVFDFTPGGTPDLRLRYIGNETNFLTIASAALTNSTFSTSIPDSLRLGAGGINRLFTLRIDAGTCTNGDFTADQGLSALGFTLSMGSITQEMPVAIKYYDSANNLLSAQTVSNQISAVSYRYSGYQSTGEKIAYAEIVYSTAGLTSSPVVTLDDLSFAADSPNHLLAGSVTGGHGTVTPSGTIVAPGGNADFVITASDYYRIATLTVDGEPLPDVIFSNNSTSYNYSWTNVQAAGALTATFTAQTASDSAATPYWWLAQYGLTNFEADAVADTDVDGHANWQEYLAGTNPTNTESVLKILSITTAGSSDTVNWLSSTGVTYNLVYSTNLLNTSGWTVYSNNIAPTAPTNTITIERPGPKVFYKITVTN